MDNITSKELVDEVEKRIPVHEWEYKGIKIWPLIRIIISLDMRQEVGPNYLKIESFLGRFKQFILKLYYPMKILLSKLRDSKHNKVDPCPTFFLLGRSSSRNTKVDGKWLDPILDTYKYYFRQMNKKFHHLEWDLQGIARIPRYSSSVMVHNYIEFCKLKAFLRTIFSKTKGIILPKFNDFVEIIKSHELKLSIIDIKKIIYNVHLLMARTSFYIKKMKGHEIEIGWCTSYSIPENLAFILACWMRKIPSVDIQHGILGEWSVPYSDWKCDYQQLIPRGFWVWSEFEKSIIERWTGKNGPFVFVGGNLWIEYCKNLKNPDIQRINQIIHSIKTKVSSDFHILLSLQPNNDLNYCISLIQNSPKSWFWWIRLHPRMLEQELEIEELLSNKKIKNCCLKEASHLPLPFILSNIDTHVTFNSSVVMDAELFNVRSLVLDEKGMEYFPEQFQRKIAFYEQSMNDCIQRLRFLLQTKSIDIAKEVKGPSSDPITKIHEFIDILQKTKMRSSNPQL